MTSASDATRPATGPMTAGPGAEDAPAAEATADTRKPAFLTI